MTISPTKNIRESSKRESLGSNNIHWHQIKGACVIPLSVIPDPDPVLEGERPRKHVMDPEEIKRSLYSQDSGLTMSHDPQGGVILWGKCVLPCGTQTQALPAPELLLSSVSPAALPHHPLLIYMFPELSPLPWTLPHSLVTAWAGVRIQVRMQREHEGPQAALWSPAALAPRKGGRTLGVCSVQCGQYCLAFQGSPLITWLILWRGVFVFVFPSQLTSRWFSLYPPCLHL